MKKSSYLVNAVVLTATSLILRAAGMIFRVVVAGAVGAEGMGLHQLIMTVYQLFITIATSGISVAATRLVTEELADGHPGRVRFVLGRTVALGAMLGVLAGLVQFAFAGLASRWWLGDARAALSLRILAPSLPFMAMAAALRGYFLARRKVGPNSRAQLFEQALRIAVVMMLLDKALPMGIEWACAAVVVGNTVSEAASCLYMALCTARDIPKAEDGAKRERAGGVGHRLTEIILPISGGRCLSSALKTAENVLVPACLAVACATRAEALEHYGALKGMAMPVLFFPFSLLGTLATLLMPEITEAHLQKRTGDLKRLISRVILITNVLAILMAGLFTLLAGSLGQLLYHSDEIGFYLAVLGPMAPFMYLESMVDGILKGMNEQMASFRYSAWDSVLRIALVIVLVPKFGMVGFLGMMLFSNVFTSLLNFHRLLKVTGLKVRMWRWITGPVVCVGAACLAAHQLLAPHLERLPPVAQLLIQAGAVSLAYAALLGACGILNRNSLLLPKKKGKAAGQSHAE